MPSSDPSVPNKLTVVENGTSLQATGSAEVRSKSHITSEPKDDAKNATTVEPVGVNGNGHSTSGQSVRTEPVQLSKTDALRRVLEHHQGDRQLVILQDFPDPDALACAWAYKLIAQQFDIHCDLVYGGTLSHQENITLVKLTGLPAQRWTPQSIKSKDLSLYQGRVYIDHQGTTSQLASLVQQAKIPLTVLIDHHSLQQDKLEAEFTDIRPQARATATIFTQYLQAGLLKLDSTLSEHVKCATALMHGIRSDTNRLMQAQEEDFLAAGYLSRYYDSQLLNAVLQASRSKQVMEVIERSLRNRQVKNNFSIAGVGYLHYDDRDAIPQAADFLVTEENVHTAVVYGIIHDEDEEEILVGSLRTNKLTLDPDEFLKEAFGQDAQGRFFGGGRSMAGGFEIPIGFLSGCNDSAEYAKMKWEVFDGQIKQKLLKLVNPKGNLIRTE
jgi:nanoRNase/pAp phosphatase (c-di-AMP/oligoRNAs hydrolase)